jgi:hypothetical protein
MEKGLYGWQTITDGCVFDLNKVLVPREGRRINGVLATNIYANNDLMQHYYKSLYSTVELCVTLKSARTEIVDYEGLQGLKFILPDGTHTLTPAESLSWVNSAAMRHLQRLFPNLDILHQVTTNVEGKSRVGQFEFEAKGFYESATFHGSANYLLTVNGVNKFAMRSYPKRDIKTVEGEDSLMVVDNEVKPSEKFLLALRNPKAVGRGDVYLKERILKIGDFKSRYRKWKGTKVHPGITISSPSILREFSLSQFTFQTYEQYKSWCKEHSRLLNKYFQSYEMFFINDDGSVNYQEMIDSVDGAIRAGKMSLFDGMERHKVRYQKMKAAHKFSKILVKVAMQLGVIYGCDSLTELNDDGESDESTFNELTA